MKIERITPEIAGHYLGQFCTTKTTGITFQIASVSYWQVTDADRMSAKYGDFVLHLRPLSSMTEEEAREVFKLHTGQDAGTADNINDLREYHSSVIEEAIGTPAVWLHLLSKGFDLFGLIPAGLAK